MTSLRRLLVVGSLVIGSVVACGSPAGSGTSSSPPGSGPATSSAVFSNAQRFDAALSAWVDSARLSGATAAVVSPRGTWSGATGKDAAGRALTVDTAFPIASVTKTVTGAEVMLLASKGVIELDKPIATYVSIPWDTRGATVRQLLGMRSGFPTISDEVLLPQVSRELSKTWTVPMKLALIDPKGPRLGTLGAAPTGDLSTWYNSNNFDILALAVEKVTGQPFASVVRRDLLGPMGLTRMWSQTQEQPVAPLVTLLDDQQWRLSDPTSGFLPSTAWASAMGVGGGSAAADAPTLARWGALLYGGKAIPASLVAQMTAGDPADGYGLATMRAVTDSGSLIVGHLGDARIAASLLLYWPASQVTVAVLVPQHVDSATTPLPAMADELGTLAQMAQ
jgi:D-alanyl-D-alanine carboxypeptidase